MPSCQAAARPGVRQAAHTEKALDEPVVLEHFHAPGDGLVEKTLVQLGVLRMRAVAVGPHRHVAGVRRLRAEMPAVRDEGTPPEPFAQRGNAIGQHVGTGFPPNHAGRRDDPLVGIKRAQHFVRVPPRVELDRTDRHTARLEIIDRRDDRRRGVESRLGAIPVRAAVVGPVGEPGPEHVGISRRCGHAGCLPEQATPAREAVAHSIAGDDRELGRESCLHVVDVAVPARGRPAPDCSRPAGTAITCSWNAVSGASNIVRPSGATSPSGITTAGRNGKSRQRDNAASLKTGNANSVYW